MHRKVFVLFFVLSPLLNPLLAFFLCVRTQPQVWLEEPYDRREEDSSRENGTAVSRSVSAPKQRLHNTYVPNGLNTSMG